MTALTRLGLANMETIFATATCTIQCIHVCVLTSRECGAGVVVALLGLFTSWSYSGVVCATP